MRATHRATRILPVPSPSLVEGRRRAVESADSSMKMADYVTSNCSERNIRLY